MEWEQVREQVFLRDGFCVLLKKLPLDLKQVLKQNGGHLVNQLDPAHVLSRGSAPALRFDPENVVVLNRYSHSMLDQMRHPIDGRQLKKEQVEKWWRYIVGDDRYDRLLEKHYKRG